MSDKMEKLIESLKHPKNAEARALLPLYIMQSGDYTERTRKWSPQASDIELRLAGIFNQLLPKMQHLLKKPKFYRGCRESKEYLNAKLEYDFEYSMCAYKDMDGIQHLSFDFSEEEFDALKAYAKEVLQESIAALTTIE